MISQSLRAIVFIGLAFGVVCGCDNAQEPHKNSAHEMQVQNLLVYTGLDEDIFATGHSYFSVEQEEVTYHAMGGKLTVNEVGLLCLKCGEREFPFSPHVNIPSDAQAVFMDHIGQVKIRGHDDTNILVGRVYCNFFNARRLPQRQFDQVFASDGTSQQRDFGDSSAAYVLLGWKIRSVKE